MKKVKLLFACLAVVIATCMATAPAKAMSDPPCVYEYQYKKTIGGYEPAGIMGIQYACSYAGTGCTYYLPDPVLHPTTFAPCRPGYYIPIIM